MSAPAVVWQRRAEEGSPLHIVFQIHHADASEALQQKAARSIEKLATRLRGAVDATVRIAADGAMHRVEITVRRPRRRALVAVGADRQVEAALGQALDAIEAQIAHVRAAALRRERRLLNEANGAAGIVGAPRPARARRAAAAAPRDEAPLLLLTMQGGVEGVLEA
ncbi:MAG: HPF/RaiA family ribosome-associated protein [Gemmatirosa sp.]